MRWETLDDGSLRLVASKTQENKCETAGRPRSRAPDEQFNDLSQSSQSLALGFIMPPAVAD
jgi:hypothetical protein